ncbi:hypothetical protein GmHk_19G054127 [Glycine max]|nr:hypothetical protein GmHk_19G054127 [Glycine max]
MIATNDAAFYCGIKLILKMNCYGLQQNAFAACEEMRGPVNFVEQKEPVICPKPRRVGVVSNMPMRHLRWHFNPQAEGSDSKAGAELLEIMFKKPWGGIFKSGLLSPSSASRKGGCVRMSFGLKPAAVRVDGFDCLNKDCQNSRIPVEGNAEEANLVFLRRNSALFGVEYCDYRGQIFLLKLLDLISLFNIRLKNVTCQQKIVVSFVLTREF